MRARRQTQQQQRNRRSLTLAFCFASCAFGSAGAQTIRSGHWGEFPARVESDSLLLRPQPRERAAWEWPLYAPYRVIRWPFSRVMDGAEGAVVFLDESGSFRRMRRLFGSVDLPYGFRLSGVASRLGGKGIGADFYHDRFLFEGTRMQLKTQLTNNGQARVIFGLRGDERKSWSHAWVTGYRYRPRARYFAPGSELETQYRQEIGWAGYELSRRLGDHVSLRAATVLSQIATQGTDRHDAPSIDDPDGYPDRIPAGYGDLTRGAEFSIGWIRDTTHQNARPTEGGMQRVLTGWFEPSTDDPGLWTSRVEAQQFWPLWHRRSLALRLAGAWIESDRSDPHFARLYSNDDPDQMRGFEDFRFRGRGMLLWNLEYRYPIWAYKTVEGTGLDFYLFQDGGQFFDRRDEIGLRSLEFSHGAGIRFVGLRGFGARFEIGRSNEDTVVRLSTDQVFQYARHGLFHGRSPIPLR